MQPLTGQALWQHLQTKVPLDPEYAKRLEYKKNLRADRTKSPTLGALKKNQEYLKGITQQLNDPSKAHLHGFLKYQRDKIMNNIVSAEGVEYSTLSKLSESINKFRGY